MGGGQLRTIYETKAAAVEGCKQKNCLLTVDLV